MIGGKYGGISNKGYRSDYNYSDYNRREKKQDEERTKKSESRRKSKKEEDSDDNEAEEYKKKVRSRVKKDTKNSTKEEPPKKQSKETKPAPSKQLVDLLDFDEGGVGALPSNLGGQNANVLQNDSDFGNFASAPSNALEDFWSQPVAAPQPVVTQKANHFECNGVNKL